MPPELRTETAATAGAPHPATWWPTAAVRGGWGRLAGRLYEEVNHDRVLSVAGGVAFFSLLALVPALTAAISLYGLIADRGTIARHLEAVASFLPPSGVEILSTQIDRIVASGGGALTLTSVVSLLVALWSATGGIKAMVEALNAAYGVYETRSFLRLNLTALGMTVGAGILALVLSVVLAASPRLLSALPLGGATEIAVALLRWPVAAVLTMVALAALYAYGPARPTPMWRWVTPGAVLATLGFLVFSILFSWYASNVANFAAAYGSLGAVIGFLLWMWLSVVIILLGAELNSIEEEAEKH